MDPNSHAHSASIARQRLMQSKHIPERLTLETIKAQLPHANAEDRLKIVHILDKLGTDAALNTLASLLLDDNETVRQAVAAILRRPHPRYTQFLHAMTISGELKIRTAALSVIAADRSPYHLPSLVICLSEDQPLEIQEMAAHILQAMKTPEALRIVTTWRQRRFDTQAEIKHTIYERTYALVTRVSQSDLVNYEQSFISLLKHVRAGRWGDQQDAAKAIHKLVQSICEDPTANYYSIRQEFIRALQDREKMVRWVAVEALARLGDPETVPALLAGLNDTAWTIRVAIIRALIEIGDVAVVSHIASLLNDPNTNVQEAVIEAIGALGSLKDISLLESVVQGTFDDMARLAAVQAIHRLRGTHGNATLLLALKDRNMLIRWYAALALSELADETSVSTLICHLDDISHPSWEEKRVCDWLIAGLERIDTGLTRAAVKQWKQTSM